MFSSRKSGGGLRRRGYDLRFDDFGRLAGVGVGTLYRHFPTREALAEAVYHEEIVTLCDQARQLQATLSAEEALADFLRPWSTTCRPSGALPGRLPR